MPNAPQDLSEEQDSPIPEGWLPIREVARQTGVNPVTLRAWERRYGLLIPQRTAKGHRLYSDADVVKIQAVLAWLERGVAVSQVAELLRNSQPPDDRLDSPWQAARQQLLHAIEQLSERKLDEVFNANLALYPPRTMAEQLLLPLLAELQLRWQTQFASALEQVFWHGWLRSRLSARIAQNNRQHSGAPLLLLSIDEQTFAPELWLTAWLASSADCPVCVLESAVPLEQLNLAIQRLSPRALLLHCNQRLEAKLLRQQLPQLAAIAQPPLLLSGLAARIHATELQALPGLTLAVTPSDVLQQLLQLHLLTGTAA
ncbi:MAG: MerR family transcriptional regulator [Pseudomonadaceae bacterium]|nr:MerR family transcriptional regulator [Pseudomonadaceae bacterium]